MHLRQGLGWNIVLAHGNSDIFIQNIIRNKAIIDFIYIISGHILLGSATHGPCSVHLVRQV